MKGGSKASVNGKDYTAMTDQDANDIDDDDSSVITAAEAKKKIKAELLDRKSTRLNSSHTRPSRMPSSA